MEFVDNMDDRKPLISVTRKDFEFQTFRSGGKGGQHQNTCDSGVRIIHRDSGAVGESRSERSQYQNRKLALGRLAKTDKFKIWLNRKLYDVDKLEREMEEKLERSMNEENLKVEVRKDSKWMKMSENRTEDKP